MNIHLLIKQKRERLGLTQKEFSDALGLGKYGDRTIRRWENGESTPSVLEINQINNFPEEPRFPNPSIEEAKFLMVDLFAGIGGIRLPFQKLGGHCCFTSEWDKFAAKTYRANFGEEPYGDITQIDEKEIPNHNILLAGFPCQAFSQAGLKQGFEDTRGTLFFDVARIIAEKRPDAFLLENVKNLRSHDKGRTFAKIKETLEQLDYTFESRVLRAADFGVPQNRERIFMVGFNKRKGGEHLPFHFPEPPRTPTRLGDILFKDVDEKYTISDKLYAGHLRRKKMHQEKGNGFGFSLFNENSTHTNTLSARYYKDGSEILIDQGQGKNPRKLTPFECKRLQGFPESYIIPVSDTQAYKQFGNSVSVPVVEAVATEMIKAMESVDFFTDYKTYSAKNAAEKEYVLT